MSRSTAACTTSCINYAAMPLSRCYTRTKKTQGGRYQLISRLTIKHNFCGGVVVLALFYLFYLLRLDSQTQDILHQLNKLLR